MKLRVLVLFSVTALAVPSITFAQATGKEAIRIVGRERGADYLARMLHLFGENGLPQPAVWRVVARDAQGAVREFYVSKGAIIAEGVIPPARANGISGTPLAMPRLTIDSSTAFQKADAAARVAKVGFDRINYQLRCLEISNNAAWFIALIDTTGARVGEVCVGASTGSIITQTWLRRPLAVATPVTAHVSTQFLGAHQAGTEPRGRGHAPRCREYGRMDSAKSHANAGALKRDFDS